ncbi:hypothetical protein WA026_013988, partial [Henosepilachna vigintioctopunctata]
YECGTRFRNPPILPLMSVENCQFPNFQIEYPPGGRKDVRPEGAQNHSPPFRTGRQVALLVIASFLLSTEKRLACALSDGGRDLMSTPLQGRLRRWGGNANLTAFYCRVGIQKY